jgi:hypothetical protein
MFLLILKLVFLLSATSLLAGENRFYPQNYKNLGEYGSFLNEQKAAIRGLTAQQLCSDFIGEEVYSERHVQLRPQLFESVPREVGKEVARTTQEIVFIIRDRHFNRDLAEGEYAKSCAHKLLAFFKTLRYIDEFISVWSYDVKSEPVSKTKFFWDLRIFDGSIPYNLSTNPKDFSLWKSIETGDVFLGKGIFALSSYAPKGTADELDMSHIFVAHPRSNSPPKLKLIETSISHGAKEYLAHEFLPFMLRLQVYRLPIDHAIRKERVLRLVKRINSERVPYDFQMDDRSADHLGELFCSELLVYLFQDKVRFPLMRSFFRSRSSFFVIGTTIPFESIFQPGLIEADPRLKLLASWRYLPKVLDSSYQDSVVMALHDWEEHHGYKMNEGSFQYRRLKALWYLRKIPLFSGLLSGLFPAHIPQDALISYGLGEYLTETLLKHVRVFSQSYYARHRLYPDMSSVLEYLESFRKDDLEKKRVRGRSLIHGVFRP